MEVHFLITGTKSPAEIGELIGRFGRFVPCHNTVVDGRRIDAESMMLTPKGKRAVRHARSAKGSDQDIFQGVINRLANEGAIEVLRVTG